MMMMTTTTSNNRWSKCLTVIPVYLTIIIIIERDLFSWRVMQIEEGFWPWWITAPKIYQMKDEKNIILSNNKFLLQLYLFKTFLSAVSEFEEVF